MVEEKYCEDQKYRPWLIRRPGTFYKVYYPERRFDYKDVQF